MTVSNMLLLLLIAINHCDALNLHFWITTRVVDVEMNTDCLAKRCFTNELLFRVSHAIPRLNESSEFEWSTKSIETERQFTSVWTHGFPEDVYVQLSLINYDPSFGFPRVCDATFQVNFYKIPQSPGFEFSENIRTFRLQGRCFNATLLLQKYKDACPWCQDSGVNDPQMLSSDMALLDRLNDPYFLIPITIVGVLMLVVLGMLIALIHAFSIKSTLLKRFNNNTSTEREVDHSSNYTTDSIVFVRQYPTLPKCCIPTYHSQTTLPISDKDYAVVLDI